MRIATRGLETSLRDGTDPGIGEGARVCMEHALRDAGINPPGGLHVALDLAAAVALARRISRPGAVVMLSPGAPSFPHFKNFEDRGNQFEMYAGIEKDV